MKKLAPISFKEAKKIAPDLEERNNHDLAIELEKCLFSTDGSGTIFIDNQPTTLGNSSQRVIYAFTTGEDDAWKTEGQA